MDIADRKLRLDAAADAAARDRVAWHGETGESCPRCRVQVPARYLLALPDTDVTGCLRCLEMQAHLFYAGLEEVPADLAGIGGQQDALRLIAQEFRQRIKSADRGREASSRREAASRWAAQSGWEASPAWEPPDASDRSERKPDRWPKRSLSGAKSARSRTAKSRPQRRQTAPTPRLTEPADILGLAGTPTRAEIVAAFRRSALVCHPDYGGSAEAFRELVAARDALLGEE